MLIEAYAIPKNTFTPGAVNNATADHGTMLLSVSGQYNPANPIALKIREHSKEG